MIFFLIFQKIFFILERKIDEFYFSSIFLPVVWSTMSNSNRRYCLGRARCYHYTNGAHAQCHSPHPHLEGGSFDPPARRSLFAGASYLPSFCINLTKVRLFATRVATPVYADKLNRWWS